MEDERELVHRMLAGKEEAFEEFFKAYFPALFRFALIRLRQEEAAEEVHYGALPFWVEMKVYFIYKTNSRFG